MNNSKKTAKSKLQMFLALLLSFVMVFSIFIFAACGEKNEEEDGKDDDTTEEEEEIDLSVGNGSFDLLYDTSETSDYPRTPKSWSYSIDGNGDLKAPSSSSDVLHGVIPVTDEKFTAANKETNDTKKFGDISNPSTPHSASDEKDKKQVLMLYNKTATSIRYKSPSITIDSNAYATISVWVKTVGITDGGAHLNLTGAVEEPIYVKDIITTTTDNNGYVQYKFFIENSDVAAKTVYIELGLGYGDKYDKREHMQGHVFFDDVELSYLSQKDYVAQKGSASVAASMRVNGEPFDSNIVNLTAGQNAVEYSFLANTPLDSANNILPYATSWTNSSNVKNQALGGSFSKADTLSATSFDGSPYKTELDEMVKNYPFESKNLLYMENRTRISQSYTSPTLTLQPYSYYKLSFWVKTTEMDDSAGLNVFLSNGVNKNFYPSNPTDKQYKAYSSFTSINTKNGEKDLTDEDVTKTYKWDNWVYYSFVLQTGIYASENIQLEFSLGPQYADQYDETLPYKMPLGAALVSEINQEKLSKNAYDAVPTGSTVNKATVSSEGAVENETITNGGFNTPQSSYQGLDFSNGPLAPSDWVGIPYSHNQVGGSGLSSSDYAIMNDAAKFQAGIYNKFGTTSLPNGNPHALMMTSTENFSYGYITPYKSLSADSYYKISIDVLATSGTKFGIYFVDNKGKILGDANYKSLDTSELEDPDNAEDYELYGSDYRKSMYIEDVGGASANDTNAWKTYNFYVKTGAEAKNYRIELWFGHMKYELQNIDGTTVARADTEKTTGTVMFDNVISSTSTEDMFKELRDADHFNLNDDTMMYKSQDVLFADYSRADPKQPEDEEEQDPEETPKDENTVDWGLIITAISTGLIIISLGIVAGRKLYLARKKARIGIPDEDIESNYNRDLVRHHSKDADKKKSQKVDNIELEDDLENSLEDSLEDELAKEIQEEQTVEEENVDKQPTRAEKKSTKSTSKKKAKDNIDEKPKEDSELDENSSNDLED